MTFEDLPTDEGTYPHRSGDFIGIGPQCFAAKDGLVLNWRGENYTPQRLTLRAAWNNYVRVPAIERWRKVRGAGA